MGRKRVVYFQDADEYVEKYFGKPIDNQTIKENKETYAKIFAEGCEPLEELLLKIWNQGYDTLACCKGHKLPESYLKVGRHKIKRMSAEEYHTRQKGSWFQKPRGYVQAPEYADPYITINHLEPKEVIELSRFLKTNLTIPGDVEITCEDTSLRILFQNQYDKKESKIDNTACWQEVLRIVTQYLEKSKNSWKEEVKRAASGTVPVIHRQEIQQEEKTEQARE